LILAGDAFAGRTVRTEIAVIGAGPAGIVLALEMADRGHDVVLVESGGRRPNSWTQQLGDAAEWDLDLHAPMALATRRQIGGASVIWGGRCVPFDPVDFDERSYAPDVRWPIISEDVLPYFGDACSWLRCGRPVFDLRQLPHLPQQLVPGLLDDRRVHTSDLERWSLPTDFGAVYRKRLAGEPNLRLLTGLTCVELRTSPDDRSVQLADCRTRARVPVVLDATTYVVACGGLESTRLLLASTNRRGRALGDHSGHLGRWYMGHVEGVVARVHFSTDPRRTVYDYERDLDGTYVRRRLSLTREHQHESALPNVTAWITNPELADPSHGSGPLSFVHLSLMSPFGRLFAPEAQRRSLTGDHVPGTPYGRVDRGPTSAHIRNIVHDRGNTLRFISDFGRRRFLTRGRKAPGFFVRSATNVYPLQYHGEHLPHWNSRVQLVDSRDHLGMRRLKISPSFSQHDVQGVVRAHEEWDGFLRRAGVGHLSYPDPDVAGAVRQRLGAGFHQAGTARMSTAPADGVVDRDLRVHGIANLFVLSSATFVTSSQANSTFLIIALANRLARYLHQQIIGRHQL